MEKKLSIGEQTQQRNTTAMEKFDLPLMRAATHNAHTIKFHLMSFNRLMLDSARSPLQNPSLTFPILEIHSVKVTDQTMHSFV